MKINLTKIQNAGFNLEKCVRINFLKANESNYISAPPNPVGGVFAS